MTLLAAFSFDESGTMVTDATGNGWDFSIASTSVARTASGHTNGGVTFGGTPAELNTALGRTSSRTVMAWLKGTPSANGWCLIWNVTSITSGCWGILWLTDRVVIQARNTPSNTLARATQTTAWDGTTWHHVAGTYDGSTVSLYIDGTLNATAALTGPLRTDNDKLEFGLTATGWTCDDLRVYDTALGQSAIQAAMNSPVSVPSTFTDSGAASLVLSATGTGVAERSGSGTAGLSLAATGTGVAERSGSGAASLLLNASGSGVREATAVGTATLNLATSGAGATERVGAGTASLVLNATGVTPADQRDITLAVTPMPSRWTVQPAPSRWTVREV